MPTRENLLQMLGMSNAVIGQVSEPEGLLTKDGGCQDGDILVNLLVPYL